jgi:hypothetical protein
MSSLPSYISNTLNNVEIAGQPAGEFLYIVFIVTAIGYTVNQVFLAFLAKPEWVVDYDGSPLWAYYMSWAMQFFIFPGLTYLTLKQYNFDTDKLFNTTFEECNSLGNGDGICWLRYDAVVLIAYFVKDLSICTPLQALHHLAGASLTLLFSYTTYGGSSYILSILLMEDANMFWNLTTILPNVLKQTKYILSIVTFVVYTVGHVFNLYILYFMCFSLNFNTIFQRVLMCSTAFIIMYFRQTVITQIMVDNVRKRNCQKATNKKHT